MFCFKWITLLSQYDDTPYHTHPQPQVRDEDIAKSLSFIQNAEGNGLSPFDSFLILRGIRTLSLRMRQAQNTTREIASFLRRHPAVSKVHYLLDRDTTNGRLHYTQSEGGGSVLSFETKDVELSRLFLSHATHPRSGLFKNTVSFGSVRSLVEMPTEMSHACIPTNERAHIPPDLVRLSVGIEDCGDLIRCISSALSAAQHEARQLSCNDETLTKLRRSRSSNFQTIDGKDLPLGTSLPPSEIHAVGVSMPNWSDVIKYEEGDKDVLDKLSSGYPRFVFLKPVQKLFETCEMLFAEPGESAMCLPSARVALRLQQFMQRGNVENVRCHDLNVLGCFAVTFPQTKAPIAKLFWYVMSRSRGVFVTRK